MNRSNGNCLGSSDGRGRGRARGAVLILSLAVLVVLALMATVFSMLAGVERNVSRNYIDQIRARFLAESGVHHAIGQLRYYLDQGGNFTDNKKEDLAWIYRGEDFNLNGSLDGPERDVAYPPIFPANGRADTEKVPLEVVPAPSYALEATTSPTTFNPRRFSIDGVARVGISGTMDAGTYGSHSDVYTLRVVDASALLYVNDVNPNMPRIVNNLCAQLSIPPYGPAIWKKRPYGSILELKEAIPDQTHFDMLSPYLTTVSWIDDKVVNPVPLSDYEMTRPGSPYKDPAFPGPGPKYVRPVEGGRTIYRYGHGLTSSGERRDLGPDPLQFCEDSNDARKRARGAVYGWDELNPQWIEITSRAPIDLNKAPREILIAVLQDLQGFFAMETPSNIPDYGYDFIHRFQYDPRRTNGRSVCNDLNCYDRDTWKRSHVDELASLYTTMKVKAPGASGSGPDAGRIVDAIIARRNDKSQWDPAGNNPRKGGPFRSWEDFHRFCDDLVGIGKEIWDDRTMWGAYKSRQLYASRAMADVLKANFNPNLHLNELNPNAPIRMLVDKTDLIMSSTEGTFRPMGIFRIDSLGRVLQPAVPGGDAFTSVNNVTVAEAEVSAMVRLFDVYHETHQKDFFEGAFAPAVGGRRTNYGLSVESGPEPHNGPAARENEWEGFVQLATNGGEVTPVPNDGSIRQTVPNHSSDRDDMATPSLPPSRLHAHFMNTFDLNWAKTSNNRRDYRVLTAQLSGRSPTSGFRYNFPDPTEPQRLPTSPYCPAYNPGRYRLARSYRLPPVVPGQTAAAPARFRYAPSDLRLDGAYSERHSALVYNPLSGNDLTRKREEDAWMQGMVSYWIKPSYDVTNAGKPRVYFNLNRVHGSKPMPGASAYWRMRFNPSPFLHTFLPHQLYDLQRSTNYPDEEQFRKWEGRPGTSPLDFEYANFVIWRDRQEWDKDAKTRIKRAVANPIAQDEILRSDRFGSGKETMIGFKPRSFAFGYGFLSHCTGFRPPTPTGQTPEVDPFVGQEIAVMTDPLNHAGHPHGTVAKGTKRDRPPWDRYTPYLTMEEGGDVLDEGRWTHVVLAWNMRRPPGYSPAYWDYDDVFRRHVQIRVNGQLRMSDRDDMSKWVPVFYDAPFPQQTNEYRITWDSYPNNEVFDWSTDEYGHSNPIRIGNPSALHPGHAPIRDHPAHSVNGLKNPYESNFPADATIDELYVWDKTVDLNNQEDLNTAAKFLFRRGRYYRGTRGTPPRFTSRSIDLTARQSLRKLPPPLTGGVTTTATKPIYRLYGMYWTAYTQSIYNYTSLTPGKIPVNIRTTFQVKKDPAGPFGDKCSDEQYSPFPPKTDLLDPTKFQYRFDFEIPGSPTLLETPIVDDVWFIYGMGQAEILEWSVH